MAWRLHTMTSAAVLAPPSARRRPSARLLVADTVSAWEVWQRVSAQRHDLIS